MTYPIDERLRQLCNSPHLPRRAEFQDPLLNTLQAVSSLSSVIDQELDRHYTPNTPVDLLSRVFSRLRRS